MSKTKLCNAFANGACPKGAHCTFAHGEDDLQPVDLEAVKALQDGVYDFVSLNASLKKSNIDKKKTKKSGKGGKKGGKTEGNHLPSASQQGIQASVSGLQNTKVLDLESGMASISVPKVETKTHGNAPQMAQRHLRNLKNEPRTICKYYSKGVCNKGDECEFLHEGPVGIVEDTICKFLFTVGGCAKGKSCQFSHDRKLVPCKFFVSIGHCNDGDACLFSHGDVSDEVAAEIKSRWVDDPSQMSGFVQVKAPAPKAVEQLWSEHKPSLGHGVGGAMTMHAGMGASVMHDSNSSPPAEQQPAGGGLGLSLASVSWMSDTQDVPQDSSTMGDVPTQDPLFQGFKGPSMAPQPGPALLGGGGQPLVGSGHHLAAASASAGARNKTTEDRVASMLRAGDAARSILNL